MNDETLSEQLKSVPMPADLSPPHGFADEVLRRRARARGMRTVAAVVAVVAVLMGTTAMIGGADRSAPPAGPYPSGSSSALPEVPPRPGGGPWVVHAYSMGAVAYLLDLRSGEYREVPFHTETSPDGSHVAVSSVEHGLGVAGRNAYLDDGEAAVTWLGGPEINDMEVGGIADVWSPDGTKVFGVTTALDAEMSKRLTSLTSYDVASGRRQVTTVLPDLDVRSVVWAADSSRYALALRLDDGGSELRYLSADGELGAAMFLRGEEPVLYGISANDRLLYSYESLEDGEGQRYRTGLIDMAMGETDMEFWDTLLGDGFYATPVGWLDDGTFARLVSYGDHVSLWVHEAETIQPVREIEWGAPVTIWSVGPSAGLPPEAADLGF